MNKHALLPAIAIACVFANALSCGAQLTGQLGIHDPSTIIKDGDRYYVYCDRQWSEFEVFRRSHELAEWTTCL